MGKEKFLLYMLAGIFTFQATVFGLINVTRLFTQYQHLLEIAVKQLMVQDGYALLTSDKIEVSKE